MTQKYPDGWSGLKYPHQRTELLAFLAEAESQSFYQDASEMKFLVNFVFDDHDFQPASRQIGLMLIDDSEAEAMADFVSAFDAALGPRKKPLAAITAEEWVIVAAAAARARKRLQA